MIAQLAGGLKLSTLSPWKIGCPFTVEGSKRDPSHTESLFISAEINEEVWISESQNRSKVFVFPWLGEWYSPPEVLDMLGFSLLITKVVWRVTQLSLPETSQEFITWKGLSWVKVFTRIKKKKKKETKIHSHSMPAKLKS